VKRTAALNRVSVIGLTLVLVAAGGVGVYYYTAPPNITGVATTSQSSGIGVIDNPGSSGYITVQYNGSSFQVAPKGANSPKFSCPVGTDPSLCTVLLATCGNGSGSAQEPWKNCANCAFDSGCTGQQSCDPYTHQCSVLVGACQVAVYGGQ
jgi:hypothetical protein